LRLFLDASPKDIGNSCGYKSFAANIHLSRGAWENAQKKLSHIQSRRALWIQGRIFIIQGAIYPFDFDTCPAKDQAGSVLSFNQNLCWQVSVIVDENRDLSPIVSQVQGLPWILCILANVGTRSKNETLVKRKEKIQNAREAVF